MEEVESESKHFWRIFKSLLLVPFNFVLFLFGKRDFETVIGPIRFVWNFFWDAKLTAIIILVIMLVGAFQGIIYLYNPFGFDLDKFWQDYMFNGPTNLKNLNFFPIIVSWFSHGSTSHLFWNCFFLFIMGRVVERKFGNKILLIYFISAICASLLSNFVHWNDPEYYEWGASGAISGLEAVAMLIQPYAITHMIFGIPLPIFLLVWFHMHGDISNIYYMTQSNTAHFAHLGGYVFGNLFTFLLFREHRGELKKGLLLNILTALVLGLGWYFFGNWIISNLGSFSFYNLGKLVGSLARAFFDFVRSIPLMI